MDATRFRPEAPGRLVPTLQGGQAFVPAPLPPDLSPSWGLALQVAEAERALGELIGAARRLPDPGLLLRPMVRREAVLSSRIEGSRASLSDLVRYELGDGAPGLPPDDLREVSNYVACLDLGVRRLEKLPVSLRWMREIHARLLEGVRGANLGPGEFRRSQTWIGAPGSTLATATFVPPPAVELQEGLGELERYLHAGSELPLLVRLALVHYQFETLHPFLDGNGRVGRILLALLHFAEVRPPFPILHLSPWFLARKDRYYGALLEVSRTGAWIPWIEFFLEGILRTSRHAGEGCQRLLDLQTEYRARVSGVRRSSSLATLVDALFETPAVTLAGAARRLGVTHRAATQNVEELVRQGILREIDVGARRRRLFVAPALLEALGTGDDLGI